MEKPILYTFRRCPYAMRARMALFLADIDVEMREISLKNKPTEMLQISPKGTVPVLRLGEEEGGRVIDESLDIIYWAFSCNDPKHYFPQEKEDKTLFRKYVEENDSSFKKALHQYKYADRHPEYPQSYYQAACEPFLEKLSSRLQDSSYLLNDHLTALDIAVFPFIRQYANVNREEFNEKANLKLTQWLEKMEQSEAFAAIMQEYPIWKNE